MPAPIDKCMAPLYQHKLWDEIKDIEILENSNCFSYAFNYVDIGDSKIQPGELRGDKYEKATCGHIISNIEKDYPELRKINDKDILSNVIDKIKNKHNKNIKSDTILDILKNEKKYSHFKNISRKDIENVNDKNTFPRFSHNIENCNINEQRYKISLVIDKDSKTNEDDRNTDYHFYKESRDEKGDIFWTHKPGTNKVTEKDASGKVIKNPELCDRKYKDKCKKNENEDCSDNHNYDTFCGYFTYPYKAGPIIRLVTEEKRNENNNNNKNI